MKAGALPFLALALASCASTNRVNSIEFVEIEQNIAQHINVLASDEFEGRKPGTKGERLTLAYMRDEFEKLGLVSGTNDPANPWLAPVELSRTIATNDRVEFIVNGERIALSAEEAIATTTLKRSLLDYAPLLFVGDSVGDRAENELVGQVVVLTGPTVGGASLRDAAFDAGAAAVLQIVDDPALIGRIRSFLTGDRFRLVEETRDELTAFVSREALAKIVGEEALQSLEEAAKQDGFRDQELAITAQIEASMQAPRVISHNLVARIPGAKPGSGALILMGHWDHFGICGDEGEADRICNGAIDNASGIAAMIEISRRLQETGPHDRDIYFLATTAEEWGLLGAKAFIAAPSLPLEEVVAVFNFDTMAIAGRGRPVLFLGQGRTPLDERVLAAIERDGRELGSKETAANFLQRQDGWAFLEQGIPSVMLTSALGAEPEMGEFFATRYHKPSDNPVDLVLSGAVEDLLLHQDLVTELASTSRYPATGE